jgi:signal transduction histidine kinase
VFEPLFQVPRSKKTGRKGASQSSVGLGLFIVREIVQGHHGTVSVKSSADAGTVFTVELPKEPTPLLGSEGGSGGAAQ